MTSGGHGEGQEGPEDGERLWNDYKIHLAAIMQSIHN